MPTSTSQSSETAKPRNYFATTQWTVVVTAGNSDTTHTRAALEKLCRTYWVPLYVYVRRRGHSPEDAQDLTQAFFAYLLRGQWLRRADRRRGRFRSFLLGTFNHFLADEWDKARARKRGGGIKPLPLEWTVGETRCALDLPGGLSAEKIYERRWALTLLENIFAKLRQAYEQEDKGTLFDKLQGCLTKERAAVPYTELARELRMSDGALRMAVHRLRQRYRQLLRSEIAETVLKDEEVEDELRYLFRVLSSG